MLLHAVCPSMPTQHSEISGHGVRSRVTASTSLSKSHPLKRCNDYGTGIWGKALGPTSEEPPCGTSFMYPSIAVQSAWTFRIDQEGPTKRSTLQQVKERSQLRRPSPLQRGVGETHVATAHTATAVLSRSDHRSDKPRHPPERGQADRHPDRKNCPACFLPSEQHQRHDFLPET